MAVNSKQTRFALGRQAAKGTMATSYFAARGLSLESIPNFDYIENQDHMLGVAQRASTQQSVPVKSGLSVPLTYEMGVYPVTLPPVLQGAGFGVVTSGAGPYTHTATKTNTGAAPYVTGEIRSGSGSDELARQLKDLRLSQVVITAGRNGLTARLTGMALDEASVTPTAAVVYEVEEMFAPFAGGFTLGTLQFPCYREHEITIDRPIEEDDQCLHAFPRNDNAELGFAVTGVMRGLLFSKSLYQQLIYGGVGGTAPSQVTLTDSLTFNFESAGDIPSFGVPYNWQVTVPKAEFRLTNFRFQGATIVRADVTWRMIDDQAAAPITMVVTNGQASY